MRINKSASTLSRLPIIVVLSYNSRYFPGGALPVFDRGQKVYRLNHGRDFYHTYRLQATRSNSRISGQRQRNEKKYKEASNHQYAQL
jgi:hypothetical protein